MKGKYLAPSELLRLQKQTGRSYWDLIGRPLYDEGKDEEKASSGQISALQQLLSDTLDTKYIIPNNIPNIAPLNYADRYGLTGDIALDGRMARFKGGKTNDDSLADMIIDLEGFLARPKDIGDGKITIGSGLTDPKYTRKGYITEQENRIAVLNEIAERRNRLSKTIPNWNELPDSARNALISYDYNYPISRKSSPKLLKAAANRDWNGVAKNMDAGWNMAGFKKGLRARRLKERELFLSELDPSALAGYNPKEVQPVRKINPNVTTYNESLPWLKKISLQELQRIAPKWNPPSYKLPSAMSIQESVYNPDIPESINRSSATATYPRTTVLPSILEYIGQQQKLFNSSPLFKPAL